jgi:hypothetical protein
MYNNKVYTDVKNKIIDEEFRQVNGLSKGSFAVSNRQQTNC